MLWLFEYNVMHVCLYSAQEFCLELYTTIVPSLIKSIQSLKRCYQKRCGLVILSHLLMTPEQTEFSIGLYVYAMEWLAG